MLDTVVADKLSRIPIFVFHLGDGDYLTGGEWKVIFVRGRVLEESLDHERGTHGVGGARDLQPKGNWRFVWSWCFVEFEVQVCMRGGWVGLC